MRHLRGFLQWGAVIGLVSAVMIGVGPGPEIPDHVVFPEHQLQCPHCQYARPAFPAFDTTTARELEAMTQQRVRALAAARPGGTLPSLAAQQPR
jgi:hypothetical protein